MKRSSVIDEIACVLVSNSPYPQAIDIPKIAEISKEILEAIEKQGMMPPSYSKRLGCDCCSETVEDWEPENEQKKD